MTEKERLQKALEITNEAHTLLCLAKYTVASEQGWLYQLQTATEGLATAYTHIKSALERVK